MNVNITRRCVTRDAFCLPATSPEEALEIAQKLDMNRVAKSRSVSMRVQAVSIGVDRPKTLTFSFGDDCPCEN